MKLKHALCIIQCVCIIFISTGCSSLNAPVASSESTSSSNSSASNSVASSDSFQKNANEESIAEREAHFVQMANHDKYIFGEIVDFEFMPYPQESFMILQCDDKEYKVLGKFGMDGEGLRYFKLNSTVGKTLDDCKVGYYATVFYDETRVENVIDSAKDIIIIASQDSNSRPDFENKYVLETQYLAKVLQDNFRDIENKKVFSPTEAMLAAAEHLNIQNVQMKETSDNVFVYTNGKDTISFANIWYNQYYKIERNEAAKILNNENVLSSEAFSDNLLATPYIQYCIEVDYEDERSEQIYVNIDGSINKGLYAFDLQGNLITT